MHEVRAAALLLEDAGRTENEVFFASEDALRELERGIRNWKHGVQNPRIR